METHRDEEGKDLKRGSVFKNGTLATDHDVVLRMGKLYNKEVLNRGGDSERADAATDNVSHDEGR